MRISKHEVYNGIYIIYIYIYIYMGVSLNSGTPKSSISIGFSIINHPFWGTPFFGNPHMYVYTLNLRVWKYGSG